MSTKAMSVRLSEDRMAEVAAVAQADDMPMSEVVREAIDKYIADRCADKNFQRRLKKCVNENLTVLERLSD